MLFHFHHWMFFVVVFWKVIFRGLKTQRYLLQQLRCYWGKWHCNKTIPHSWEQNQFDSWKVSFNEADNLTTVTFYDPSTIGSLLYLRSLTHTIPFNAHNSPRSILIKFSNAFIMYPLLLPILFQQLSCLVPTPRIQAKVPYPRSGGRRIWTCICLGAQITKVSVKLSILQHESMQRRRRHTCS